MRKDNIYDNIPEAMKRLKRFVGWKKDIRKNKKGEIITAKLPFSLIDFKAQNWNNKFRWINFEEARDKNLPLGFVLVEEDNIIAIDLDDAFIDGKLKSLQDRIVKKFEGTYIEYSQSGQGLHIFVKGRVAKNINIKKLGIEVYKSNRYIALTGNIGNGKDFSPSSKLLHKQEELDELYKELSSCIKEFYEEARPSLLKNLKFTVDISSDKIPDPDTILETMDRTNRIASGLINGHSYTGDHSRDDFIFLLLARNYTHEDPGLMGDIFLKTALNRLGTGEKRRDDRKYMDYLQNTIDKVLSLNGYRPFDWTPHFEYKKRVKLYEAR